MKKIYWLTGLFKHNKEIDYLYNLYKPSFISFALKNYPIEEETVADIYQESFMSICQNVQDGKYVEKGSSLKTYLFEIGKHQICKYLNKHHIEYMPIENLSSEWFEQNDYMEEWTEAQDVVSQLIEKAEDDCGQVLKLYYWERLKMVDIAKQMNYKTEQVAKNKKSSCLRRFAFELKRRLAEKGINWKR